MDEMRKEMEREYVKGKLAWRFYEAYCEHGNLVPRERAASWAFTYADIAVDVLGYDQTAIESLAGAA